MEVRLMPVQYAFAQEVTLYRREPGEVRTETNAPAAGRFRRIGGGAIGGPRRAGRRDRNESASPSPRSWSTGTCSWDRRLIR